MKKGIIITVILLLVVGGVLYFSRQASSSSHEADVTLSEIKKAAKDQDVENVLSSMTLEQKVGQMFMGCFYGGTPTADTVSHYNLGGVLLFGESFKNVDKTTLTNSLHVLDTSTALTPVIAVDEEGGTVSRLSGSTFLTTPFQSPRALYAQGGLDAVIADTHKKNALLKELGIDLNLAPVCDISQNPRDFMYERSLGQDAQITADYAAETVKACQEDNIGCALKHFPGYGNSADTHKGLAVDNRSLEQLQNNDFLPFEAGIDAGASAILVSHNVVYSIDNDMPASLSPAMHRILREDMDFDGVIITDDLSMGAVANFSPGVNNAVSAVLGGNDILCSGDYAAQYAIVLSAVNSGVISEDRIDMSVRKIIKWKIDLGLINADDFSKNGSQANDM